MRIYAPRTTKTLHICERCGAEFTGGITAKFCPDCKVIRAREYMRDLRRRKKLGIKYEPPRDMEGKTFGRLTVLKEEPKRVYCRCECGKEKWYIKDNVKSGKTTSCGCSRAGRGIERVKNTVGNKYGMLTVLQELGNRRVLCRCDCGREKIVNKSHLLNGNVQSCGCLLAKQAKNNQMPYYHNGTYIAMIRSQKPNCNNKTSGIRGVCWNSRHEKWRANICIQGSRVDLGYYDSKAEAATARRKAEEAFFKPEIDSWEGWMEAQDDITELNTTEDTGFRCGIKKISLPGSTIRYASFVAENGKIKWLGAFASEEKAFDKLRSHKKEDADA